MLNSSSANAGPPSGNAAYFYGLLGVLCFSLTLPATRMAISDLDPVVVGLGRSIVAAFLAAVVLLVTRQAVPARRHWKGLLVVVAGVVVGFPLFSAWAMQRLPASHGAVVVGILPLATAIVGAIRLGERPSALFWFSGAMGSLAIVAFAWHSGAGHFQIEDLALLTAVLAAAVGYAEGGRLAREMGGWRVICWALVMSAPLLLVPVLLAVQKHGLHASPRAWLGFGYVSCFSMFLGFFAWYHGLALGGVARVGQVQLLQPFLTMVASSILLGEVITPAAGLTAAVVIAAVAIGRKARVIRAPVVAPSSSVPVSLPDLR